MKSCGDVAHLGRMTSFTRSLEICSRPRSKPAERERERVDERERERERPDKTEREKGRSR